MKRSIVIIACVIAALVIIPIVAQTRSGGDKTCPMSQGGCQDKAESCCKQACEEAKKCETCPEKASGECDGCDKQCGTEECCGTCEKAEACEDAPKPCCGEKEEVASLPAPGCGGGGCGGGGCGM